MHQKDFSKIKEMNINCDVIFANQCDQTSFEEMKFGDSNTARMISTQTRGVGINRNLTLMYATGKYCLLADDDVVYDDDMKKRVVSEFESHPDADVMIFHFESDDEKNRSLVKFSTTKKWHRMKNLPFGGIRIAFRLESVRKANVYFTSLFGGGCTFPSGEDSIFLSDLRKAGLKFYVSKETIGKVSFEASSWFTGYNEKFYYGKGAFYQAVRPRLKFFWMLYFLFRSRKRKQMKMSEKLRWMKNGARGYKELLSYDDFKKENS